MKWSAITLVIGLVSCSSVAAQDVRAEEEFLKAHSGLSTDSDFLLAYFRARSGDSGNLGDLEKLVGQLASGAFKQREDAGRKLLIVGETALPLLQKQVGATDPELARRAKQCIETIQGNTNSDWSLPIVRILAARKPAGALEALLAYVPRATEEAVEEEIYYALDRLIAPGDAMPVQLVKALEDSSAARRAVSACIIGRRGTKEQKRRVAELAAADADCKVRLRAAQGLLAAHEKAAVPALISLLRQPSISVGWQAEELLRWAMGQDAPKVVLGCAGEVERIACHEAWTKWWAKCERSWQFDPERVHPGGPCLVLGHTKRSANLSSPDRIWTMGSDASPRYTFPLDSKSIHIATWLSENHFLALAADGEIFEFEACGRITRSIKVRNLLPHVSAFRRLSPKRWEIVCLRSVGYAFDEEEGDSAKRLPPERLKVQFPEWRVQGDGPAGPDGFRLATDISLDFASPAGCVMRRVASEGQMRWRPFEDGGPIRQVADGKVHWEAFLPPGSCGNSLHPLIRFGFESELGCDTLERRLAQLRHENRFIRRYAVARLCRFKITDQVYPHVLNALKDPDELTRENTLEWLAKSSEFCAKALPTVSVMLDDKSPYVFRGVWPVFKASPQEKAIQALTDAYRDRQDPGQVTRRSHAAYLLGNIYFGKAPQVTDLVREAIVDPEPEVRKMVLSSIACNVRARDLVHEISNAVADKDEGVSREAVTALAIMGKDGSIAIRQLIKLAVEKEAVRGQVVSALGVIGREDPTVKAYLMKVLTDDSNPSNVASAVKAIGKRQDADEKTIPVLTTLLTKWADRRGDEVRREATSALGNLGPSAQTAVPVIVRLALETDGTRYWEAAIPALGRIDRKSQIELKRVLRRNFDRLEDCPRILMGE